MASDQGRSESLVPWSEVASPSGFSLPLAVTTELCSGESQETLGDKKAEGEVRSRAENTGFFVNAKTALPSSCLLRQHPGPCRWQEDTGEPDSGETPQNWQDGGIIPVDQPFDAKELLQNIRRVLTSSEEHEVARAQSMIDKKHFTTKSLVGSVTAINVLGNLLGVGLTFIYFGVLMPRLLHGSPIGLSEAQWVSLLRSCVCNGFQQQDHLAAHA